MKPTTFSLSVLKRVFDFLFSSLLLIITFPLFLLIISAIMISSGRPVFFVQKRVGKDGGIFKIVKFRTMVVGASRLQARFARLNESDGPVFKIKDDPRFTKFGKILSKTGLDELPQFLNVIKGEMSIVGPRPLPVGEAKRLTKAQKTRQLIKPGITSSWVVRGSHELSFRRWMRPDAEDLGNASLGLDLYIIYKTLALVARSILKL